MPHINWRSMSAWTNSALLFCNDTVVSLPEAPYTQTGVQDSKGLISAFLPLILSTLLFNSLLRISELSTCNPCTSISPPWTGMDARSSHPDYTGSWTSVMPPEIKKRNVASVTAVSIKQLIFEFPVKCRAWCWRWSGLFRCLDQLASPSVPFAMLFLCVYRSRACLWGMSGRRKWYMENIYVGYGDSWSLSWSQGL